MRITTILFTVCLFATTACAQSYELIDRTGQITATVEARPGRLLVYESTGDRIYFSRDPRYDSTDGVLLGFFNYELNRVLRFPRSGAGAMQLADLDDAVPRFRVTQRTVRPSARRGSMARNGLLPRSEIEYGRLLPGPRTQASYDYVPGPPYTSGYRPLARTQSVLIDSEMVANRPIAPVAMQLTNSGPQELRVAIVDLRHANKTRHVRIPPGKIVEIQVERDAGGRLIQNFRTISRYGEALTKEIITPIPPEIRYELVVHEWAMQSIAIDRTGKSPSTIEDVNFQGRGLGRFPLPPGPELQPGQIDVFATARRAGNPGSVAPITSPEKPWRQINSA